MADLTSLYKNQPLRDRTIQACFDYIERTYTADYKQVSKGKFTDFFDIQGGTQPPKSYFIHEEKPNYTRFLQIRDFASDSTPTFIPVAKSNKTCIEEDILLGRYGASVGKILTGKSGAYNVACAKVIIEPKVEVSTEFLFYLLHSSRFQNAIRSISRSAQGGFNKVDLSRIDVSFPDLERQKRVVEVLHHVDKHLIDGETLALDSFKMDKFSKLVVESIATPLSIVTDVEAANKTIQDSLDYLTQLRQTLLREAMQGQLLPQDPTDEPADVLLQQLQAEKAKLVKDKRTKWEFPLHMKSKEEPPFVIPESWAWVRLWDIAWCFRGQNPPKSDFSDSPKEGYVRFVQITDFKTEERAVYVPVAKNLKYVSKGEIIMAAYRHIGKLSRQMEGAFNVALCKVNNIEPFNRDFLELLIKSDLVTKELLAASERGHIPSMHSEHLLSLWVVVPPLAEQHRIVAKLEQLLQHCDALEQRIRESRRLAEQLLATALREALAPPAGATSPEAAELELAEAETPASHGRRATAGKQRKVPASLGPLFD